jgi:thiamine pyrophosphokinase
MKAIIVSGGNPPAEDLLFQEMKEDYIILSADSGANCLYRYGVIPDYLMGDFDSIDQNILDYFIQKNCKIVKFPRDKDYTDTQLALHMAFDLKADKIIFLGCTGSRLDHTLGNIGLLLECLKRNIEAAITDEKNVITIKNKAFEMKGNKGELFSILAYTGPISNLYIEGAKFELNNFFLPLGNPVTISNEFLADNVRVTFSEGTMLVIRSRD